MIWRITSLLSVVVCLLSPVLHGQPSRATAPVALGKLASGATVSFVPGESGGYGIEIAGADSPRLSQPQPFRVEVFDKEMVGQQYRDKVQQLASDYKSAEKTADGVLARAEIAYGNGVKFQVEDRWSVSGLAVLVRRTLKVAGSATGGFSSAVMLVTDPQTTWSDLEYMAPTLLYGDTTMTGERSPGGRANYAARRYGMREDWMPASLLAMSFRDGNSVAVLNPAPNGETTAEESHSQTGTVMIDERYQFGALIANEAASGGVELGFSLPASVVESGRGSSGSASPSWRRRYHPIKNGLVQNYQVAFRLARDGTFAQMTRNTWRWAWDTLKPQPVPANIELIRRTLLDHLADRVITIEGRTGIPYLMDSRTGEFQERMDATRAAMGFCAKNLEAADQFLREADRDPSPRGKRMREIGLAIIDTFIRILPMSPPGGDGFDLFTGRISPAVWSVNKQFLRPISEDMLVLVNAYHREKGLGRDHPEWLRWAQVFTDWMLTQQREDGSIPRSWKPGTSAIVDADGKGTYNAPPLLLAMYRETGHKTYLDAAVRAGEYVWESDGIHGTFHGGATDASSSELVTDGEAGHLAMLAFLRLYETTKQPKWLERAKVAADFSETWIWAWNVPMPADEDEKAIHWQKGVPTVGISGITARSAGGVDIYMSWAAPMYAELYTYTKDEHYLDVARVLLHAIDLMVALPGRPYNVLGPGWTQENWRMSSGGAGRGFGTPGKWLPWLATIRLHAITGIEETSPNLLPQLVSTN